MSNISWPCWHDHDVSSGAVAVVSGELVENNLTLADGARERRVASGTSFSFGPDRDIRKHA